MEHAAALLNAKTSRAPSPANANAPNSTGNPTLSVR
jgi:hypothetical protein